MSVAEIAMMSLVLYAGSGQFVVAGMLHSGALAGAIVLSVFFVNLRHLLMSTYLAPKFGHLRRAKCFAVGALLTDETFGVASAAAQGRSRIAFDWMCGLNLSAYLNWFVGNIAGAMAVGLIPESALDSLRFALVAMFIGLIALQILPAEHRGIQSAAALFAMALLVPATALIGGEFAVVAAASLASLIALVLLRWKSEPK